MPKDDTSGAYVRQFPTPEEKFGAYLRKLRAERGLSLRKAALLLGIGHMRLDEIEKGKSRSTGHPTHPKRELVAVIADVYDVPRDALLEMAGYAREQPDLSGDEHLVVTTMRRLDDHHRDLALEMMKLLDRAGRKV